MTTLMVLQIVVGSLVIHSRFAGDGSRIDEATGLDTVGDVGRSLANTKLPTFAFQDITATALPWEVNETDPGNPAHRPSLRGWQGAHFVDLNGDGMLDYFNVYHYTECGRRERLAAAKRMEEKKLPPKDASYCGPYQWAIAIKQPQALRYEPIPKGYRYFRVQDVLDTAQSRDNLTHFSHTIDVHSSFIGDLDRDGRLDLYVHTTSSKAVRLEDARNALYWGTGALPSDVNSSRPTFQFSGGRGAAYEAGESRHMLVFDMDLDGYLDFLLLAKPSIKLSFEIIASEVYRHNGKDDPRSWTLDALSVAEFASTAIFTDADGDGYAREVILWRMRPPLCDKAKSVQKRGPAAVARAEDITNRAGLDVGMWLWWCNTRPPHSLAMFTVGVDGTFHRIDNTLPPVEFGRKVEEWASSDLDGDGLADLLMLQVNALVAFPSSNREPGEWPSVNNSVTLDKWDGGKCRGHSLAVADFDLDGDAELLVVCTHPGENRLYTRRQQGLAGWNVTSPLGYGIVRSSALKHKGHMPPNATSLGSLKPQNKGVSVADIDNNGFPDLYIAADGPAQLLRNRGTVLAKRRNVGTPSYVALQLVGKLSNLEAIGATVVLTATGPTAHRKQVHEVRRSPRTHGFDDERIVFGLGIGGGVQQLDITWPTGVVTTVPGSRLILNSMQPVNVIHETTTETEVATYRTQHPQARGGFHKGHTAEDEKAEAKLKLSATRMAGEDVQHLHDLDAKRKAATAKKKKRARWQGVKTRSRGGGGGGGGGGGFGRRGDDDDDGGGGRGIDDDVDDDDIDDDQLGDAGDVLPLSMLSSLGLLGGDGPSMPPEHTEDDDFFAVVLDS